MLFLWLPFSVYAVEQPICPWVLVLCGHTISLSQEAPEYPDVVCIFIWYHHVMSNRNTFMLCDTALGQERGGFCTSPEEDKSEPF